MSSNGVHLDIIYPTELINGEFLNQLRPIDQAKYVAFGWGDKGFYINTPTWDDLTLETAFKALLINSETAMHTTFYTQKRNKWIELELCEAQLDSLSSYIKSSFKLSPRGDIMEIYGAGYTKIDKFFEANGDYNCINTCNSWVNKALKKAKVKTAIWSPTDHGVLYHLRQH